MAIILVVDDDTGCRQAIRAALERMHHEVYEARNGFEAMLEFARVAPSLVFLDVLMPEKDGIETILELRATGCKASIVGMSDGGSFGSEYLFDSMVSLGAFGTLRKPFSVDGLSRIVDAALASVQKRNRESEARGLATERAAAGARLSSLLPHPGDTHAIFEGRVVELLEVDSGLCRVRFVGSDEISMVQFTSLQRSDGTGSVRLHG